MHFSYTKSFNIPVSIALTTLAHMLNVYEICLNTTNYPIFNMKDFRYCLRTSILDCFWSAGIPTMSAQAYQYNRTNDLIACQGKQAFQRSRQMGIQLIRVKGLLTYQYNGFLLLFFKVI